MCAICSKGCSNVDAVEGDDSRHFVDSYKASEDSVSKFSLRIANSPTETLASSTFRVASGVSVSYSADRVDKLVDSSFRQYRETVDNSFANNIGYGQQHSRYTFDSNNNNGGNRKVDMTSNSNLDEVFDTLSDFPKLIPLSSIISSQVFQSSSTSSTSATTLSSNSSSSTSRLPLLCRRKRTKQNNIAQSSGVTSFLPRQSSIVEEDEQQQQHQEHSIVEKIFLRAAVDLQSWEKHKVKNAKLMLRRLGVQSRPKAMSYPAPQSPVPIIKVTNHSAQAPKTGSSSRDINNSSGNFLRQRQLATTSVPNLLDNDNNSSPDFLKNIEYDQGTQRKDSVSRIRKKSLVNVVHKRRLSNTSSGSQHGALPLLVNRRSSSICGSITTSRSTASPVQDYPAVLKEEGNLLTWSNLLSSIPPDERKSAHIRRHQICLPIPVCMVGQESTISFTSLEVIEQTLRRLYPDIILKKRTPSKTEVDNEDCDETSELDDQVLYDTLNTKGLKPRRLSVQVSNNRRESINTCINSMKSGLDDYDKQLSGVKSVGTFADEEELKVLIAKRDAIACVTNAMMSYPEKEELQLNACLSLLKMASVSESNCVHILQNDGLKPICNTLRLHSDNVDIVRPLLSTIAYISTAHDLTTSLVNAGVHCEVLQAMSVHANDADIVRESCYIIGNLLNSVEIAQKLMYAAAVHTIINLVLHFTEDANILENVCRTIGSFAIYDETCQDVADAGATNAVLRSMTSPAANAGVTECGCWALACLTATVPTCKEFVALGGIKVIIQILTDYPREEGLQDYGIRVLCNLSQQEETVLSVCSVAVFKLLYNAMIYFSTSVELLEIIFVTLCQIFTHHEKLCKSIVDTCFLRDLVNNMMEFPDNRVVQEQGCKIIGNMAVEDDLRRLAESQGASKAVISAMLTNNTDGDIQDVGCMAIMNLSANNKENKVRIKNAGVVPAILNCLQEFQHDATIVLSALKALGNLISLEEVCHLMLDEKGLDNLIALTEIYEEDQELLMLLIMIFSGITELPDLKEEEADVIDDALTRICTASQNSEIIALYFCQATERLIRTAHGRDAFIKKNRLGSILWAMQNFQGNVEIHRTCCKLIAFVSFYTDNKKRLITETTIKSVVKSMGLFPLDIDLQIIACGTISCIVQKIAILKHELIGHGGIALLKKAVINHRKESRLAVMSLITLDHVLPIDYTTYPTKCRMTFDIILHCMKNFPENKEVQLMGCRALSKCHIHELNDVHDLSEIVIQALRRHGEDPEMQRQSAHALKNADCSKSSTIFQKAFNSPKISITDEFWKIWETK